MSEIQEQAMQYAEQTKNNVINTYQRTSTFQRILLFVVIIILIYFIYKFVVRDNSQVLLLKDHDARIPKVISSQDLPPITVSDYTISTWIFINEWNYNYGLEKNIVARYFDDVHDKEKSVKPVPSITLDAHTNNLLVNIAYNDPHGSKASKVKTCKVSGVPLQKWVHVIVTINNRTLDVYIDGKLTRTCIIPGVPQPGLNSDLYISGTKYNPGFSGKISDVKMINYAINPTQANYLYRKGNSMSSNWFNKYHLKFALMENNKEKSTLII